MNTNWIGRLQHILYYLYRRNRKLRFLIVVLLIMLWANFVPQLSWVAIFLFILLFYPKYLLINPRHHKAAGHLRRAIDYIRKEKYPEALGEMIKANNAYPNMVLEDLIKDFSTFYNLNNFNEIDFVEREIKKTKDKKLIKILTEIKKTLSYITEHTNQLHTIKNKISDLTKEKQQAPDPYKKELQNIIDRYENIRQLEEAKISFYNEMKSELWQLHKQYLYRNKIELERQKLSDLEKQFLNDSVLESMEANEKTSFVDYENAYLDALAQYSDEINDISSSDLFEEVRREFENKRNSLKK